MFAASPQIVFEDTSHPFLDELETLDPMNMTPIEALLKLQDLKANFLN
jgi:hypothetical protein